MCKKLKICAWFALNWSSPNWPSGTPSNAIRASDHMLRLIMGIRSYFTCVHCDFNFDSKLNQIYLENRIYFFKHKKPLKFLIKNNLVDLLPSYSFGKIINSHFWIFKFYKSAEGYACKCTKEWTRKKIQSLSILLQKRQKVAHF